MMRQYAELVRRVPELSDGRISIRRWHRRDVGAIVDALADGSVSQWIVGMPHPYSRDDARRFIARAAAELDSGVGAHLALEDVNRRKVVGAIAVELRSVRHAAEMGYWIAPRERGRGYTMAALALLMAWAFTEVGLARLELVIHVHNPFSQAVASRSGFRREGVARAYLEHRGVRSDYYVFARLPGDPEPAPHPVLHAVAQAPEVAPLPLVLRPWRMADASLLLPWLEADTEVRRWAVTIRYPVTAIDEQLFIAESYRSWLEQGTPAFAVVDAESRALLGSASVHPGDAQGTVEIGYMVRPEARGRGVATAALASLTDWCLGPGGFRSCDLLIDPENVASMNTAAAAGYVRTCIARTCTNTSGHVREHVVFRRLGLSS